MMVVGIGRAVHMPNRPMFGAMDVHLARKITVVMHRPAQSDCRIGKGASRRRGLRYGNYHALSCKCDRGQQHETAGDSAQARGSA
jgi:hypothetical protein